MKQTIAMKQAAFEELMREHGFQYLGATTYDGSFIYQRTWHPRLFQPQAGNQRHPGNPPVRRVRAVRRGGHE